MSKVLGHSSNEMWLALKHIIDDFAKNFWSCRNSVQVQLNDKGLFE